MFNTLATAPTSRRRSIRIALLALLAVALLAASPAAAEMTLEEILGNYYDAVGGKDAWAKVKVRERKTGSTGGRSFLGKSLRPLTSALTSW